MFRKAQQSVAHQSTLPSGLNVLGNRDLRALQEIINTEKDFIKSNARSAQDFHKTAEAIKVWSATEGEDLHDVMGKLSLLFDSYTTAQTRLNAHLSTIRQHFKSVRTREEALADMRARKRSLGSKIESVERKLAKMGPENKELMKTTAQLKELRAEMESLRVEVQAEEAAIGDYKRRTVKEAMGIKCGGLLEMAEKLTIVAEVGKLIIEEIPLEPTHPGMPRADYLGSMRTDQLLQEATRGIADVGFAPTGTSTGVQRQDYGMLRQSEMDDSTQDYYNTTGGDPNDEISRAGWNEEDAQQQQHQGQDGYEQSASYDQHYSEDNQTTPIYATHAASATGQAPPIPIATQDTATDEWRRSRTAQQTPSRDSYSNPTSSTPIADQFASRSPQDIQVGGTGLRMVSNGSSESIDRPAIEGAPVSPAPLPPSASYSTSPLGASVPSAPQNGAPHLSTPPATHPSQSQYADENETYFQSVGSTRAAQQSVRRPMSPSNQAGSANASLSGHLPASPYEPQTEGRKMTAAAFRKGFGRAPSSQYMGGSTTSLGMQPQPDNGDTAPLAIRKRFSAVPGQTAEGYPDDNPAPPYQPHHSVYGGMDGAGAGIQDDYAPPQPPHIPWGSRPNSRPGSAAGWQTPNSSFAQQ